MGLRRGDACSRGCGTADVNGGTVADLDVAAGENLGNCCSCPVIVADWSEPRNEDALREAAAGDGSTVLRTAGDDGSHLRNPPPGDCAGAQGVLLRHWTGGEVLVEDELSAHLCWYAHWSYCPHQTPQNLLDLEEAILLC